MSKSVVIIGAGPAGLSCALWLINQGAHVTVLEEAEQPCGMLRWNHHPNDWLLGFRNVTGQMIGDAFLKHIQQKEIHIIPSTRLISIEKRKRDFRIEFFEFARRRDIDADFLVVATGTHPKSTDELQQLSVQHPEKFFIGAGRLKVEDFSIGERIAVLGGGDNAFENAYLLAKRGVYVDIYCRSEIRARRDWIDQCKSEPTICIHSHESPSRYSVNENQVVFDVKSLPNYVDAIAVMYGYEPNTRKLCEVAPWISGVLDESGFIKVDLVQQTAIDGLFAIGDVTNRPLPCLPSAIGQGSVAAKAIAQQSERKKI